MVLRVLRLLRLARAVRLLVQFRTMWKLVSGLLASTGTICYTFLLITLILYVFACLGNEMITKNSLRDSDPVFNEIVEEYFPDIMITMLTLIAFVMADSMGPIYAPLIKRDPWLVLYFVPFILIVSIAVMNLVTAVIVEGAIEQAKEDKDVARAYKAQQLKAVIPKIRNMFYIMDKDGSGDITLAEVADADDSVKDELLACLKADDMVEMFEMLDVDGSGSLDIEEFCDGITKMTTSEQSVETMTTLKLLRGMRKDITSVNRRLARIEVAAGLDSDEVDSVNLREKLLIQLNGLNAKSVLDNPEFEGEDGAPAPAPAPAASRAPASPTSPLYGDGGFGMSAYSKHRRPSMSGAV